MELPDSLTSIGARAFYQCTGLTSLILPDSAKSISTNAFEGCSNLTLKP
ncbi:MAG: leucine-rich repeat protein [Oscillospiraceae bacterium]|nr:leucine-rich repeat protein [Oscillospiraceae bacterium]